ncbi:MAG: suppressor of fused domain protein [Spirochaetaceae bacterium]|jgi:tetratricopeptide (TPR) repeat protein|nr:suppressor of fused domain protein [Spirochaetaceae bacterium]
MNDRDRSVFVRRLIKWHDEDKHRQIISAIEALGGDGLDYEISSYYARALNNLNRYQEALDTLLPLEREGSADGKWYFRVGYSLYHLGREAEAAEYFRKAIDYGDDAADTRTMLELSLGDAEQRRRGREVYHPELYTADELDCLEDHILRYFGAFHNVFHELSSPDIHVDIAVIEPTKEHNYYTLITMGMGAHRMNVPPELGALERAELLISLPPDWNLEEDALADEKWYWPLQWLKILARLPIMEDTYLGWGHTLSNEGSIAENTELEGILLLYPGAFHERASVCEIPGGQINFYQLVPIYREEMEFKINNSVEHLLEFLDNSMLEHVDIARRNVCKGWDQFSLKKFNLI